MPRKMNPNSLANLKSGKARGLTSEEAKKIGRIGGIQSQLKQNASKYLQELTIKLLTECSTNDTGERYYARNGLSSEKSENALEAIVKGHMVKALKGDKDSTRVITELLGIKTELESAAATTEDDSQGIIMIPTVEEKKGKKK